MPQLTQHELLINYILTHSFHCTNEKIFEAFPELPNSTIRARLAELRIQGRLIHGRNGYWHVADSTELEQFRERQRQDQEGENQNENFRFNQADYEEVEEQDRLTEEIASSVNDRINAKTKKKKLGKDVKPILLDRKTTKKLCVQRIDKIGIELEGGWDESNYPEENHHDGSVSCEGHLVGETCSPPLKYNQIESWVTRNYPDHSNKSCGMHVHFSFTNELAYMQLLNKEFYEKVFLPNLREWGETNQITGQYWQRLDGNCSFCLKGFKGEIQKSMEGRDDIRYYHLNYCYSLINSRRTVLKNGRRIHPPMKTIECRVFPIFKKKDENDRPVLALKAIDCLYNLFNNYLAIQKPEKTPKVQEIQIDLDEESLESEVCV